MARSKRKICYFNVDVNSELYLPRGCCFRLHCSYGYVNSICQLTYLTICFWFHKNHTSFVIIFHIVGFSIHASCNVERHIVALEADEAIFHALLKPLIRSSVASKITSGATTSSEDPEGDVLVV